MSETYSVENNRGKTRYEHIDVIRGIAILLVVLGHSIGYTTEPLNKFILIFHMPLFFFLSGVLAKPRNDIEFSSFLLKKGKALLIPQVTLGIITYLYDVLLEVVVRGSSSILEFSLIDSIFRWWFLIVLFLVEVVFYFLSKIIDFESFGRRVFVFSAFLIFALIIQLMPHNGSGMPLHLNILPIAFLYFLLGFYCKNIKSKVLKDYDLKGTFLMLVPILMIVSGLNSPVKMYENDYGNLYLFILGSLLGIYLTHVLGWYFKDNQFLQFLGRNSIVIYVLQFKVIQTVRGVSGVVIPISAESSLYYIQYLATFLISVVLLVPITIFCNKYLSLLFGKDKRKTVQIQSAS